MATPSATSGPPPEGAGTPQDTEGYTPVETVRKKKLEHAAKVVSPAAEKERLFTLSHTFSNTENDETTFNLYAVHQAFITKLMEVVEGDVHLHPTARRGQNDTRVVSPPIRSAAAFPETDKAHRLFFRRQDFQSADMNSTTIRIFHAVLMKEDVETLKAKMMPLLKEHKLWMSGGDFNAIDTAVIGWFPKVHPYATYRPTMEEKINQRALDHPRRDELISKHIPQNEIQELPWLYIHIRTMNMGQGTGRVTTTALNVSCVVNRTNLMKELLSDMDEDDLGYDFLPNGFLQIHGVESYKKWMLINNDYQNDVLTIAVQGFFEDLLDTIVEVDGTQDALVRDYLVSDHSILSLEQTQKSDTEGRYLFIVKKTAYQQARMLIEEFCVETFPILYGDSESDQVTYKMEYFADHGYLPRIHESAPVGGSVSIRSSIMLDKLKANEASHGNKTKDTKITWAQRAAPRLIFEKTAAFPALPKKKTPIVPMTPQTPDDKSVASTTTVSTAAAPISVHTTQSHDASTIVSEMRSIFTEQSKQFELLLERSDRHAKEQADASRAFMEKMFDTIATIVKQPSNPPPQWYQQPYYAQPAPGSSPYQQNPPPPVQYQLVSTPPVPPPHPDTIPPHVTPPSVSPPAQDDIYSGLTDDAFNAINLDVPSPSTATASPAAPQATLNPTHSHSIKAKASVTFQSHPEIRTFTTTTTASELATTATYDDNDDAVDFTQHDDSQIDMSCSQLSDVQPPKKSFSGGSSQTKRPRSPGSTPEKTTRQATTNQDDLIDTARNLFPTESATLPPLPPPPPPPKSPSKPPPVTQES